MARVLVVEDEYLIAAQTASIVEDAGYTVIGPEASVDATRKVLADQKVDLALLDINLGGEMVFPISEILDTMDIPYIFVTSYPAFALPGGYGDRPLVQKPYVPELLVALIEEHLQ
jgi:DNA-binding response OmpR family regulator